MARQVLPELRPQSRSLLRLIRLWWHWSTDRTSSHMAIVQTAKRNKLPIEIPLPTIINSHIRYASVLMYSSTWLIPSKYCSWMASFHGFSSILITALLLAKSHLEMSGGRSDRRLFWMCNSRSRVNSPNSRGSSRRSLSRRPNWK